MDLQPPPLPTSEPAAPVAARTDLVFAAIGLAAVSDFLFWGTGPGGTAFALFLVVVALAFTASAQRRSRLLPLLLVLNGAAAVQAVLEFKPSTAFVSSVLLLAIVGEAHFDLGAVSARWFSALLAALFPFRAFGHLRGVGRAAQAARAEGRIRGDLILRAIQAGVPAFLLAVVFSACFANGNAIFHKISSDLFSRLFDWLAHIDLSFGRFVFWAVVFTGSLSLLRPARSRIVEWAAGRSLPRWQRADEALGRWQSIAILVVLNALFFSVNTIDVVYLWSHATLPAGVNPSEFLHEGVTSLILAVIASAVVLVLLFQQRLAVGCRLLQWLASAWVLQNIVVIAGVFLRLKLYVDDFQLTLLRVGVALFLLLVVTGFGLLTVYFWRDEGLGWLCKTNALATFLLFFFVQFADLGGAIANYNVGRYLADGKHRPDVEYLASLGHDAWPALIQLSHRDPKYSGLADALNAASEGAKTELTLGWRGWELRPTQHSRELLEHLGQPLPKR